MKKSGPHQSSIKSCVLCAKAYTGSGTAKYCPDCKVALMDKWRLDYHRAHHKEAYQRKKAAKNKL